MRDVSKWLFQGHGEKSTLPKEDLLSPDNTTYVMKYPREFDGNRVNWEDINEVIAAEIAKLLKLKTVEAEIAYRNEKRGCLMLHFINQYEADFGETGAALLSSEVGAEYDSLKTSDAKSKELTRISFSLLENFSHFDNIKFEFIAMLVFDILIGNQDRHPYNWQILYKDEYSFFGPLYDNGASLGWQLSDDELKLMLHNKPKLNRFFKRTKVKAGLFENKQPPLNANHVLTYCKEHYPDDMKKVGTLLSDFDMGYFSNYISEFPLISVDRKKFLKELIEFRLYKLIQIINRKDV